MANEIHLAFEHPSARSKADEDAADPRDRISLRDYIVSVDIGAFQTERGKQQRLQFNVVVELIPFPAPLDDDVDKILSYDTLTEAIQTALGEERLNLLETLAERVADLILSEPQPVRVFVRIEKLDRGPGALGVEIVRRKARDTLAAIRNDGPAPVVIHLDNAAIADDRLNAWLDHIQERGQPVILTVGPGALPIPKSAAAMAQRRIDLLAIEQNAWVLAGRDARCVVTSTRTELDWSLKHNKISVWAPSKIVLDAVDGPDAPPHNALALSRWLGNEMSAIEVVLVGAAAPQKRIEGVRQIAPDQFEENY